MLDRIFLGLLTLLIVGTPFAIGSAPPRWYSLMEVLIFVLVIIWMLKILGVRYQALGVRPNSENLKPKTQNLIPFRECLPIFLLVGVVLFQLMPLPPALLRILSPSTHEFYSQIFAGWPEQAPYGDLTVATGSGEQGAGSQNQAGANASSLTPASLLPATWLPLTVAPYLTRIDLLKLIAFTALFLVVRWYPFGESWEQATTEPSPLGRRLPEERFFRWVVFSVLSAGFLVALVGFAQRFSWNGRILWVYEPFGGQTAGEGAITRASGPFVNPDHFANYLAVVLPLALAGLLFRTALVARERQPFFRLLCASAAVLIFTGILLSLSRGALAGSLMAIIVLIALTAQAAARRKEKDDNKLIRRGIKIARSATVAFCLLLIVALYFAGPSGRQQFDKRMGEQFSERFVDELSLGGRSQIWRDSPKLIADFPLFGVGLGAWPEVFMRYRSDPWGLNFFREAHNDYIQLLCETGMIGFALLAWFVLAQGKNYFRSLKQVSSRYYPLAAAIVAALAGMALHEWFDFNLKIPANAFLFVLLAGLGLRAVASEQLKSRELGVGAKEQRAKRKAPEVIVPNAIAASRLAFNPFPFALAVAPAAISPYFFAVSPGLARLNKFTIRNSKSEIRTSHPLALAAVPRVAPYGVILLCLFLSFQAMQQNPIPYPFNLGEAESLAEAKENILLFPTNALYHVDLLRFMGDKPPLVWQLRQYSAALWLEPANPHFRDGYATALFDAGRNAEGLRQLTLSVRNAPALDAHTYLSAEALPKLPADRQRAIEEGFQQALARQSPGAVDALAGFYGGLGRFDQQASLFEQAAARERSNEKRVDLSLRAGLAYAKAGKLQVAQRLFSSALADDKTNSRPYEYLIKEIYGARKDLLGAKQVVAEGLRNGAPPLGLQLALAAAAGKAGEADEARAALTVAKAVVEKIAKEEYGYDYYLQLADGAGAVDERDHELAALLAALELQPGATELVSRIANLYLAHKNYDRGVLYLEKLAAYKYNSAEVYFRLAKAEEARYHFAAAGAAYSRAIELAPENEGYRTAYDAFKTNVAAENDAKRKELNAKRAAAAGAAAKGKAVSATGNEQRAKR